MRAELLICLCLLQIVRNDDLPPGCYLTNYTSTFTRCDLTFLYCFNYMKLKDCVLRKCERYIRGAECSIQTAFVQDESDCYRNCCGSNKFEEEQCDQYNQSQSDKQSKTQTNLTIILALIASFLVVVVAFFAVRNLRCCDKSDHFRLIKYNIKWRKTVYSQVKCEVCRTFGPVLVTPCNHHFHLSCFQQSSKEMECPKCSQPIRQRIRIFCLLCRQKSFKVKIAKVQDIPDAMAEGKALHIDECPRQIRIKT